jgi:hypothetical protein
MTASDRAIHEVGNGIKPRTLGGVPLRSLDAPAPALANLGRLKGILGHISGTSLALA